MAEIPDRVLDAVTKGPDNIHEHDGMVLFSGPEAVDLFRLHAIRSALAFEINTGMKMSRMSALAAANAALGTKYRRKQHALDRLNEILDALAEDPWEES